MDRCDKKRKKKLKRGIFFMKCFSYSEKNEQHTELSEEKHDDYHKLMNYFFSSSKAQKNVTSVCFSLFWSV